MQLSEKQWVRINRFMRDQGAQDQTEQGVMFTHPRIPFELHAKYLRFRADGFSVFDIGNYRVIEWRGEGWVARRSYVGINDRDNRGRGPQTSHEVEGDLERADEDMVLALLTVPS